MVPQISASVLCDEITLDVEGLDRLYLNSYIPMLQTGGGVAHFFKEQRGMKVTGTSLMAPITKAFVERIQAFARQQDIPIHHFKKGERKEEVALKYRRKVLGCEGVYMIGVAQERAWVFRTVRRRNPKTGQSYPWLDRSTVMCNYYYFYLQDKDWGPMFIKYCSYFPYTSRACMNGHEYAKRRLAQEEIPFMPLDNGILSCANPQCLWEILNEISAEVIEAVVRKWRSRLPQPLTHLDRQAGYDYDLSILQMEVARTQIYRRPAVGRAHFEAVIRDHLDLGRPDQVSLIFDRRVTKKTPGSFRTRVITQGVSPSLHVSYKLSKIKQYFKDDRGLRTETTINNTRDFGIGKRLKNFEALYHLAQQANQRLLDVQALPVDHAMGEDRFQRLTQPVEVEGQRAAALRYGEPRTMALLACLCLWGHLPAGFRNRDLRKEVAHFLGQAPAIYSPGRMTYDLRRLRLHGLIQRKHRSHSYEVTSEGLLQAHFLTRLYNRVIREGGADLTPCAQFKTNDPRVRALTQIHKGIETLLQSARMAG